MRLAPSGVYEVPAKKARAVNTKRLAYERAKPRISGVQQKVEAALKDRGLHGATDEELEQLTGIYLYTVAPRRNAMVTQGLVKDSGLRRPTKHGGLATVWIWVPVEERFQNNQLSLGEV